MAIRRSGRLPPSPILMSSTSRSLQKTYAMPTRSVAPLYPVRSRASSVLNDRRAEDYYLFDRVSDVSFLSNATLDESDDTVRRSRGRDQKLLRDATNAIVSSESYATPQTSVAARRVVRGRSVAPRAASVPPRPYYPDQAAIIASKMEPDPLKRRRPRSEYAARKYRQLRQESKESIYSGLPSSGGLHATVPPAPRPSDRKVIRTEDGYSKPKNLLSWQYRLDSMVNPKDVLYEPSSFGRIRNQVRDAQDRLDRHRQLLDRYLPEEGEDSASVKDRVLRKMADMEKRDPVSGGGADTRRSTRT